MLRDTRPFPAETLNPSGRCLKALIPQLIKNDYEVVTLSRTVPGNSMLHWQIDLTQPHVLDKVTGVFDQIVHLAANVDACNTSSCFVDNVFGTPNMMKWAEKKNIQKIIYASTSGVYDIGKAPVSEMSPIRPVTLYAWTKYLGECIILKSNSRSLILRFPHIYGYTDSNQRTMQTIIKTVFDKKAVTVRDEKRDYLYIEDSVRAIIKAVNYRGNVSIFNCGSGQLVAMEDIVKIAMKPVRSERPIIVSGKRTNVGLDSSLARRELKWEATISISCGVEELIKRYAETVTSA